MDNINTLRTSAARKLEQASALIRSAQEDITWIEGEGWPDIYDMLGNLHGNALPLAVARVETLEVSGITSI